jgi:GrpB-like predicted nucleotidyltransferase (UPF0157 family)
MKVTVVPPDPAWAAVFEAERAALQAALGSVVNAAHHIGSTAVAGLAAKPVIDIMLEVSCLETLDAAAPSMEALGYEVMGEFGMPGRRYFRKGGDDRTHQVHAFITGDAHIQRHLAFRDYLRGHQDVARLYADLKWGLAASFPDDIAAYCEGKNAFVTLHEALALQAGRQ